MPGVPYCTANDVLALGIPSTIWAFINADTPGAVSNAILVRSDYVETRLQPKWRAPYSAWDSGLRLCVAQLAAYDLMSIQYGNAPPDGATGSAKSVWRQRYEDAELWLQRVRDGLVVPNIVDSSPAPELGESVMMISAPSIWNGCGYGGGRIRT